MLQVTSRAVLIQVPFLSPWNADPVKAIWTRLSAGAPQHIPCVKCQCLTKPATWLSSNNGRCFPGSCLGGQTLSVRNGISHLHPEEEWPGCVLLGQTGSGRWGLSQDASCCPEWIRRPLQNYFYSRLTSARWSVRFLQPLACSYLGLYYAESCLWETLHFTELILYMSLAFDEECSPARNPDELYQYPHWQSGADRVRPQSLVHSKD